MKRDYGVCYVNNIRKPFIELEEIEEGVFEVWLTAGRGKDGKPLKGEKVRLFFWDILHLEGE